MSDIEAGAGESAASAAEPPRNEARRFREVLDDGRSPGPAANIVRGIVRDAPLLALASAFFVGVLIGRRR